MSRAYDQPTSAAGRPVDADGETVTPEDVGRELRRWRKALGETQAESAAAVEVSRPNLAQWETGKYLPSEENARRLDDHFRAANALYRLVEAARAPQERSVSAAAGVVVGRTRSLAEVFHGVGRALVENLIYDDADKPLGWRHNLQTGSAPTPLSTAYGISALQQVGTPYAGLHSLVERLYAMRLPHGWQGRSGGNRPEVTAAVLDALFSAGTAMSADEALNMLEGSLDNFSRTRPYILSCALHTAVRLWPDASLTGRLIDDLLATRLDFDGTFLWPEKHEPALVLPEPSVVHTARAVTVLHEVLRDRADRDDVREAVEQATEWLISRTHPDDGVEEGLTRLKPGERSTTGVVIRHFTSAWVVQALVGDPLVPVVRLNRALHMLWSRYDTRSGLFAWGSGDLPIWMTLDAVTALRAAALAVVEPPLSPPIGE